MTVRHVFYRDQRTGRTEHFWMDGGNLKRQKSIKHNGRPTRRRWTDYLESRKAAGKSFTD